MRVLLDTHVFLWANVKPDRLRRRRELLEDPGTDLLLSAASSWEIAIKFSLGRLPLPTAPSRYVPERIRVLAVTPVAVDHAQVLAAADLPPHHDDPFDRLLIAQAQALRIPVVTADRSFESYDVEVLLID
jgi:PIN domain nuclease of toxin-antitoxin system